MQQQLKNNQLTLVVDSFGAELQSIVKDGAEYLWQADKDYWARHAPVLFPIVGKLKGGRYTYGGKTYQMGGHGFARDSEFGLVKSSEDELVYELRDSEVTLTQYPFKFSLKIGYQLSDNQIRVSYRVMNQDEKPMFFSIGAHPAFNIPLAAGAGSFEDYQLTISPLAQRSFIPLDPATGQLRLDDIEEVEAQALDLTHGLFQDDALIYSSSDGETSVRLSSTVDERSVTLRWRDMPYFGLWSPYPKAAPFVCIEPWCGLADDENTDGDLTTKYAINELAPSEVFERTYSIEIE